MSDYIAVFKPLIDKLGSLIEIFDLSFFVSGGLCVALVSYGNAELGLGLPYDWLQPQLGTIVALTLWAYTCGLVCVVAGRSTRKWANKMRWTLEAQPAPLSLWTRVRIRILRRAGASRSRPEQIAMFKRAFEANALGIRYPANGLAPFTRLDPEAADGRVHALLWGLHQQEPCLRPSFDSLRSFWVRAAVYDGLSTALVLWATGVYCIWAGRYPTDDPAGAAASGWVRASAPLRALIDPPALESGRVWMYDHPYLAWWMILGMVWSAALCWREANRTEKALREDLIASTAWFASRPATPEPARPTPLHVADDL